MEERQHHVHLGDLNNLMQKVERLAFCGRVGVKTPGNRGSLDMHVAPGGGEESVGKPGKSTCKCLVMFEGSAWAAQAFELLGARAVWVRVAKKEPRLPGV